MDKQWSGASFEFESSKGTTRPCVSNEVVAVATIEAESKLNRTRSCERLSSMDPVSVET